MIIEKNYNAAVALARLRVMYKAHNYSFQYYAFHVTKSLKLIVSEFDLLVCPFSHTLNFFVALLDHRSEKNCIQIVFKDNS